MFLSGTGDVAGNLRFGEVPTDVRLVDIADKFPYVGNVGISCKTTTNPNAAVHSTP